MSIYILVHSININLLEAHAPCLVLSPGRVWLWQAPCSAGGIAADIRAETRLH